MATWPFSADRLRAMYARDRGDATAGYPVFRVSSAPVRRRHWWRWILGGATALVVLVIAAGGARNCS
jgi:hypothetical protein